MNCQSCGTENREGRKFCAACGRRLAVACPACATSNEPGEQYCGECGTALSPSTPTVAAGFKPASGERTSAEHAGLRPAATKESHPPRAYPPRHLAEKILTARSALEGERKQVTVLFADVKGSMELAEQLDPEEWSRIMQRFFQILSEGVERFDGFVDKFTGDGIMALFGAPIAHEDHAHRACYAALHLLDRLRTYANELRLRRGLSFSVRLGINSGEVIVGKISDDLRMDYTAQGHTVGLAARMEQIAEPGKVYLTAHTAALIQGYFALADLGEMEIKGVQGAMHVHELQGLGQMRTRLDVSRSRGFSRFVGRGDEMHVLESALARARDGHAQIIGIVGDAGLGKSRLCYEFLERCRARGLMTYETTGVAHGKAVPFLPVLRLFRAFYGITEQDSDATARERIAGRLLLLDERLRESLPLNFEFMGVADPENPAPRIDPEARQRQMFDIVRRVIQARGQKETTVTLLEDLHWFDGGSAAFLEPMIEAGVGSRALVLLNFRPEYQAPWMGKSYYQQLPLAPLGPEAIRELLDALLGNDPSTAGLAETIHVRTAGNPFFTEEVVQNLIESKKLQGSKGAYRLMTPIDKLEVPSSVHALLAARIDRLAEREKDVLQTAAVIGREFDEPTLAAVVEQDAPQLREALQTLKDTEFVYEQSLYPVAEYLFKHPLTQEVALASQLQERRKRLHAAVARVIEAAHAHDLDQQAALLAHHWEQAGEALAAAMWHQRAADWVGVRDRGETLRHWQRVRALAASLPESSETLTLGVMARDAMLIHGMFVGMTDDEAAAFFREGMELAAHLPDTTPRVRLLCRYAATRTLGGALDEGRAHLEEALRLAEDSDNVLPRFVSRFGMASSLWHGGQLHASLSMIAEVEALCGGDPEFAAAYTGFSPYGLILVLRASVLTALGRPLEAVHEVERAIEIGRGRKDNEVLLMSQNAFVPVCEAIGDTAGALTHARQAVELADGTGGPALAGAALQQLSRAQLLNGEGREAAAAMEQALATTRKYRTGLIGEGSMLASLAEAYLVAGDASRARATAELALATAGRRHTPVQEITAHLALARVLLATDGVAGATAIDAALDAATTLMEAADARLHAPPIHVERARLARLRGDAAACERELDAARRLFIAMGAPARAQQIAKEVGA
jgi:class 3 adenylate cyclase/tetratricopeptide (TPR) repeat protein